MVESCETLSTSYSFSRIKILITNRTLRLVYNDSLSLSLSQINYKRPSNRIYRIPLSSSEDISLSSSEENLSQRIYGVFVLARLYKLPLSLYVENLSQFVNITSLLARLTPSFQLPSSSKIKPPSTL